MATTQKRPTKKKAPTKKKPASKKGDGGPGTADSKASKPWKSSRDSGWYQSAVECDIDSLLWRYDEQIAFIERLEKQTQFERDQLPKLQARIERAMAVASSVLEEQERYYDEPLRVMLKNLRLKDGYPSKPTGAKAWNELVKRGAADDQIIKNLVNVRRSYSRDDFEVDGTKNHLQIKELGPGQVVARVIVDGTKEVVAEIRRIFSIGQPTAKPKPSAKKKTAPKKKAPPKKVTAQPAAEKVEEEKTAGASPTAHETTSDNGAVATIVKRATGKLPDNSRRRVVPVKKPK